ncbi:MAG: amidohydrolase family protein [Bacteroidota bacterium]
MKRFALLLFIALGCCPLFAQEDQDPLIMDFERYDPPSTLVVPEHPTHRAKFPFIDIHSHHWRMHEQDLELLIRQMDSLNMAIVINLSGRNSELLRKMVENAKRVAPNRIAVFSNINLQSIDEPDWSIETVKQIEYDFKNGSKGLKIYKSQGMFNKDNAGNRIRIDDPRIDAVWAKCGELGMPVLIHSADPKSFWEPHDENNERWLELKLRARRKRSATDPAPWEQLIKEQHNVFKKHPQTNFIAAHMDWHANDLQRLGELLDEMPNMYVEIGAVIAELGRQPRAANRFFEQYQDRVLFGKDYYKPSEYSTYFRVLETDDEYFPYYKRYHAFWRMYGLALPDDILKKLYYKNALKILPDMDATLFPE